MSVGLCGFTWHTGSTAHACNLDTNHKGKHVCAYCGAIL